MANQVIKGARFHHIALKVKDIDLAERFYLEGLGFTKCGQWGEGDGRALMVDMGDGGIIEIFAGGREDAPGLEDASGLSGSFFHLAIGVEDARAAFQRAIENGAVEKVYPKELTLKTLPNPTDVVLAFVYGPNGEVIEFMQHK